MAWTRDKYPVWFLKVSNSSLTGRQPELQRTSSLSHSAGEDGSCISGDGGFGPPSSPTPGKHLQFLLFCFLHGQLIIVDNVASLFSKSLVWILFFINYRNGFWHWNFVFDHQQGSGCEAAFLCACFTWITILFFFLRINSTETCSFSRRKRDLEVKVCIFKWLL